MHGDIAGQTTSPTFNHSFNKPILYLPPLSKVCAPQWLGGISPVGRHSRLPLLLQIHHLEWILNDTFSTRTHFERCYNIVIYSRHLSIHLLQALTDLPIPVPKEGAIILQGRALRVFPGCFHSWRSTVIGIGAEFCLQFRCFATWLLDDFLLTQAK